MGLLSEWPRISLGIPQTSSCHMFTYMYMYGEYYYGEYMHLVLHA